MTRDKSTDWSARITHLAGHLMIATRDSELYLMMSNVTAPPNYKVESKSYKMKLKSS